MTTCSIPHRSPLYILLLLAALTCTGIAPGYAQTGSGVAQTRHYQVHLGIAPLTDNQQVGAAGLNDSGAAESGMGHVITVAIFDRDNGKRVTKADVTATVIPTSGQHSVHLTMDPVEINGYTTFEAVAALQDGSYKVNVTINGPRDATPEVAQFETSVGGSK